MKRITIFWVLVALLALLPTLQAQDDTLCYERGGNWDADADRCTLNSGLTIEIIYPLEVTAYPFADRIIGNYFESLKTDFTMQYIESGAFRGGVPVSFPWSLYVDYEWFQHTDTIFSLLFSLSDYTGGAHPNLVLKSFTFDTQTSTELSLSDVLQPGALDAVAPLAVEAIKANLGDFTDDAWLAEGTAPTPENYATFVLTPESIIFFFQTYQVAAGAAGPQQVEIPLTQVANKLQ